ncbi:hypothetical protein KDAU_73890 [Dictyobacter aurantiacus]|uniref:Transposase IS4-like domain-containing protein n=1 Tax=Dictyobacter aurantiacus TaxID=1936993 RepID=A0A401ZTF2_9CHLR|nr:transposase [Dictyobacter aurantiacus]GCE10060.1 hypothetical protein KDAU_73890 [Dictyobacter aurantiacus]
MNPLQRPGITPQLSDSELVTIALYQELIGKPREDHFFRLYAASLRVFFPRLNERTRYNRRKRSLWSVILAVRTSLQLVQEGLCFEKIAAIGSAPVPCVSYKRRKQASDFAGHADYGICSSKAMKYFGCKLHIVVSLTGLILGFVLTKASLDDNQPVVDVLDTFPHHLEHVLWDGAYIMLTIKPVSEASTPKILIPSGRGRSGEPLFFYRQQHWSIDSN